MAQKPWQPQYKFDLVRDAAVHIFSLSLRRSVLSILSLLTLFRPSFWRSLAPKQQRGMGVVRLPGDGMAVDSKRSVKWIDGLRGLASFLVICTHLTRAFDTDLFLPTSSENAAPRLLQWPILRIPWQGRIGVTIFCVLTGYVCALKPIKLARAGQTSAALSTIAKSAFRRAPRLMLPATIATFCAWTLTQFGAFTVALRSDSDWLRDASPVADPTIRQEFFRFFHVCLQTWVTGHMDYDDHQWTLLPLLRGAFLVYLVLSATIYMKPKYRMAACAMLYVFYWHTNNAEFDMQFIYGLFLSDFAQHPPIQELIAKHRWIQAILSPLLIVTGLFLGSFPYDHAEWVGWSNFLLRLSHWIFPPDAHLPKFYTAFGLDVVAMGIVLSPTAKHLLSSPTLLWLGRNSFAVYLIHGTLLRTVLVWMVYGISGQPWVETVNDAGEKIPPPWLPRRGRLAFTISLPIWLSIVYTLAHLWTTHVEAFCARLTQRLEQFTFEEEEKHMNGLLS